ncbi:MULTISPECIES: acyl-homoserine-lactone synthase [unclassified Ruegeria]|uniref:acyl-homoserine-lactone synthase n=1 Tax=unclassified Ruegeria TaxID=2625375 RepID=UPI001489CCE0|nr:MULTISPECIES: acyl-homoserine-lactone synthase [unclassified Ruegeria]NOD46623.1 GNAT family N-acetyltransferase [Ruegeria sp. HKCCD5849]NOD50077.1 GNAT family N-acetyltransferase [Ruegeria sp. HKCCD5851]NOD66911.1 GNAT family N-acetyltransferase [Ruegeria sp. HKCCD7303]NOE32476.1 GNAT family N-acetyltransferase [Ruegeria sp. HKCCD7318]
MIIVIDGINQHKFKDVLDDMFKLRARVFGDRLGWEVNIVDGRERDMFDDLNPAHVVSINDEGEVVGCMRLLQTTGPHMLSDVFNSILDGEPPLRSSQVWEATRFCVDTKKLGRGRGKNSVSYVTSEVMIGSFEYAKTAGVLDSIAVIDPVMNRVLQRSGNAPYDYLGSAKPMGKVVAMAALMDCSDERISGIRDYAGIDHDVFMSDEQALELFAQGKTEAPANTNHQPLTDLEKYFVEQMNAAKTEAERQDVLKLIETLMDTFTPEQRTALLETPRAFAHEA